MADLRLFTVIYNRWFIGEDYDEEELCIFAENIDEAEKIGKEYLMDRYKVETSYETSYETPIQWKIVKICEMKVAKGIVKPMMCRVMGNG